LLGRVGKDQGRTNVTGGDESAEENLSPLYCRRAFILASSSLDIKLKSCSGKEKSSLYNEGAISCPVGNKEGVGGRREMP